MNNFIQIKNFFGDKDFSIGSDTSHIKPKHLIISEDQTLSEKLYDKVFTYDTPQHTNTSFYVITLPLSEEEMFKVRRYIWNENKYDLYFTFNNKETLIANLFYAKESPKAKEDKIKIDSFRGDDQDIQKIEAIKRSKFESGSFWLSYSDFLKKTNKIKRVDTELIEKLKELKTRLLNVVEENDAETRNEIVQALIDRTLFIKYLEDNLIINSSFYKCNFGNDKLTYKELLTKNEISNINKLFKLINEIFNNFLFQEPSIEDKNLNPKITSLISEMMSQQDWNNPQLSLFDFRFDVIATEFISHIYEAFSEEKQLKKGIFFTPNNLAQLIVDDTITKIGSVLDPACGSGMFLVLAFRKLLEFNPVSSNKITEIIEHKNGLIKNYIFGIEKEDTARRIALFSLYLEMLRDINPKEIEKLIEDQLKKANSITIFPNDFTDNIITANSLETERGKIPHENKSYDYIVGNPPFLEIDGNNLAEQNFINKYKTKIDGKILTAKKVVGHKQISQCFMLKIKDWAKTNTRFGFVINSSNFYNEKSLNFQEFFFQYFQFEKFYELSKVKELLFLKSRESVSVVIFNNNKIDNNTFDYYSVEPGIFSENFTFLIIHEDKKIGIDQKDIFNKKIKLREYLIGNNFDLQFIKKLKNNIQLKELIFKDKYYGFSVGMRITGKDIICPALNKSESEYDSLPRKEQKQLIEEYKTKYLRSVNDKQFSIPYIEYNDIEPFQVNKRRYIREKDIIENKFRRNKNIDFFKGRKLLLRRMPKDYNSRYIFPAFASSQTDCFSDSVFSIRLKEEKDYYLILAILNSNLIYYYLNIISVKRYGSRDAKIDKLDIKHLPIPKQIDYDLASEILGISQKLTSGEYKYDGEINDRLNDLIFDLYDLGFLEKRRIKDFFSEKREVNKDDLKGYEQSLIFTLEIFFKNEPVAESYIEENLPFGLVVVAIYFNKTNRQQPTGKKTIRFITNEILENNPEEKFLAMREKIYGKDCIYIIKNNQYHSWTITKAYEDGQEILKRLRG